MTVIIKFDLPINGTKARTLDELKDNLTSEIVDIARSGKLGRWFKSRKLDTLVESLAVLLEQNPGDADLCLGVCALLEVEAHPDDVAALFSPPPEAGVLLTQSSMAGRYGISDDGTQIVDHQTGLIFYRQDSRPQALIAGRYEMSADGSEVTDHQTGLIWRVSIDENLSFDAVLGHAGRVAQATGRAWRVPTIEELKTLVDNERENPASSFPDMPSKCFWSSSPYVGSTGFSWVVDFDIGGVDNYYRNYSNAVRLVRGG